MNTSDNFITKVIFNYVKRSNYAIEHNDLKLQLQSNPDYPSVKSITDTLDYFNIENVAANVPKDALSQLPNFFLAIISKDNKTSIAQVDIKQNGVKLLNSNGKKYKLSISDFKAIWNGTIIAIDKNTNAVKSNINSTTLFKNPIVPFVLIAAFALINPIISFNIPGLIYTITAAVGLLMSYYIVRENIGLFSQSTSKICNSTTNNTSCGEVINSNASKLFGLISLSDATVTYFLSLLFILPIVGYSNSFFLLISIVALPVILYTIYQQAFLLKKWCPLCLVVASLILAQTVVAFITFDTFILDVNHGLSSLFIFGFIFISWSQLKSLFVENISLNQEATEYLKFKRNHKLFSTLLEEEPIAEPVYINEHSIVFGNPKAKLTINAITNPLCGHCTKAFKAYNHLLNKHPEDVKLNVIFNVPSKDLEQASSQVSQRIIELYQDNVQEAFLALQYWFEVRDATLWQTKYCVPNKNSELNVLTAHKNICNNNDIAYTPATIINNYKFPKVYNLEDISFFIDNLTNTNIKKEPSIN
jgi:uncharacterized membrane protein